MKSQPSFLWAYKNPFPCTQLHPALVSFTIKNISITRSVSAASISPVMFYLSVGIKYDSCFFSTFCHSPTDKVNKAGAAMKDQKLSSVQSNNTTSCSLLFWFWKGSFTFSQWLGGRKQQPYFYYFLLSTYFNSDSLLPTSFSWLYEQGYFQYIMQWCNYSSFYYLAELRYIKSFHNISEQTQQTIYYILW